MQLMLLMHNLFTQTKSVEDVLYLNAFPLLLSLEKDKERKRESSFFISPYCTFLPFSLFFFFISNCSSVYFVLYKNEFFLYIGDKFNHFLRANKKNFHTFFKDKNIAQYLKEHQVDFDKEEDLEALLLFCTE